MKPHGWLEIVVKSEWGSLVHHMKFSVAWNERISLLTIHWMNVKLVWHSSCNFSLRLSVHQTVLQTLACWLLYTYNIAHLLYPVYFQCSVLLVYWLLFSFFSFCRHVYWITAPWNHTRHSWLAGHHHIMCDSSLACDCFYWKQHCDCANNVGGTVDELFGAEHRSNAV